MSVSEQIKEGKNSPNDFATATLMDPVFQKWIEKEEMRKTWVRSDESDCNKLGDVQPDVSSDGYSHQTSLTMDSTVWVMTTIPTQYRRPNEDTKEEEEEEEEEDGLYFNGDSKCENEEQEQQNDDNLDDTLPQIQKCLHFISDSRNAREDVASSHPMVHGIPPRDPFYYGLSVSNQVGYGHSVPNQYGHDLSPQKWLEEQGNNIRNHENHNASQSVIEQSPQRNDAELHQRTGAQCCINPATINDLPLVPPRYTYSSNGIHDTAVSTQNISNNQNRQFTEEELLQAVSLLQQEDDELYAMIGELRAIRDQQRIENVRLQQRNRALNAYHRNIELQRSECTENKEMFTALESVPHSSSNPVYHSSSNPVYHSTDYDI